VVRPDRRRDRGADPAAARGARRRATAELGSGFISADNNDGSAENMWNILREAGVDRSREIVVWNVVPWYIGTPKGIRAANRLDIEEAH
jgi:hypothetical protein